MKDEHLFEVCFFSMVLVAAIIVAKDLVAHFLAQKA
tara:strand:- start:600 stop:707 length:108 start_codon:yes stop_codon:yes gene_type:complete